MHGGYENESEEAGRGRSHQPHQRYTFTMGYKAQSNHILEDAQRSGLVEKPKLAIVPFRHSKITELFQDFFTGEGRAVSSSFVSSCFHSELTGDDH